MVGGVESKIMLQGRQIGPGDMAWLQDWIDANPTWSRKQIARDLCRRWDWVDGRGRLKDFAARSLLLKLESRGRVKLPALRTQFRRKRPEVSQLEGWEEPSMWVTSLGEIAPVRLEKVRAGSAEAKRWAFYLERYHYLGFRVVGENVGYLARDREGRDVGCLLFGAAAWRCAPRDRRLGWSSVERQELLWSVVNNTRFLILPKIPTYCYTSSVLGCQSNSDCCSAAGSAGPRPGRSPRPLERAGHSRRPGG